MAPPTFIYSVKFICGIQDPPLSSNPNKCLTVQPGYYSTEINIHNFHPGPSTGHPATINKQLLLLIDNGVEKGKETNKVQPQPFAQNFQLFPGEATFDDCCNLLKPVLPPNKPLLSIGFLVLQSDMALNVTAVYTASDPKSGSISIDVETINERQV